MGINKLSITKSARSQVLEVLEKGHRLCLDLRTEALGDKVAALAMGQWLHEMTNEQIYVVEADNKRTKFMLRDCILDPCITVMSDKEAEEDKNEYYDCIKSGHNDSLWVMNPYLHSIGIRSSLKLSEAPRVSNDEIVIIPLTHTQYNQRRDWDLSMTKKLAEFLQKQGRSVTVLYDKDTHLLEDYKKVSFEEFLRYISEAKCLVAGDTGASHLAAALDTKQVAVYPDWIRVGLAKMSTTISIAEWWGIPAYWTPYSFLPNADPENFRLTLLDDAHCFSLGHIMNSIRSLCGK